MRILLNVTIALCLVGCNPYEDRTSELNKEVVVIYTSWDQPHSQPILKKFEAMTGILVEAVYDTEASKTIGLVNRLIAEKKNPKADVFWNSEIVRTLILKKKGLLAPYKPKSWEDTPAAFRDEAGYWTGFAGRSRVLIYNNEKVKAPPLNLDALLEKKWLNKLTIANPLFGTTSTEVATWYSEWGESATIQYLSNMKLNKVLIAAGNAMTKDMVVNGEAWIGLTDTDDAWGAIQNGKPVNMVFLDQNDEGALLIPNTVSLIQGAPNEENAKQLIDFLTSHEVAEMLAFSRAGQIPLKANVNAPEHVKVWADKKFKTVDFEDAVEVLPDAMEYVRDEFLN